MFFTALEQESLANQAQRTKLRYQQAESYLDANPDFEQRVFDISERYAIMPPELIFEAAASKVHVDSKSMQDLCELYTKEWCTQAANDWQTVSEQYKNRDYADDMTMNYVDLLFGIGGTIQSLYREDKAAKLGRTQTSLWAIAGLDAASEFLVKWSPSYRSSIEKPGIDMATGERTPGSEEYDALPTWKKIVMEVPVLNLALKENKALFNGRVWAYAQQMNAYDRFLETGTTKAYAQEFIPINLDLTKVEGIGRKENWIEETKQWVNFAKEAKELGGEPYLYEMINQLQKGAPINYNRDNIVRVESLLAENSPEVAELVKMGYSEEQAASIYYSQVGTPIKKPDEGSEINWTSIQKPNQIEAFAGRRFIWSPEAAQQYSENHQKNVNEKLGIMIPYSSGRYQASLKHQVGTEQYNKLSGFIDGSERIIPELLGGGLVRMAKKAGKLTSHVNKLLKFEDDLYTPAKRNEIIQTYAKTNNPFTGLKLKKGEDALKDIDLDLIPNKKLHKDVQETLSNAAKATYKLKKEWTLLGTGYLSNTPSTLVSKLKQTGKLADMAAETSRTALRKNNWTKEFPEQVQDTILKIKSEDAMEKFMLRLFDEGVRLRGMDRKFQLDSIPKAQAGLINAAREAITGKPSAIPSIGSLMGRAANRAIRLTDNTIRGSYRTLKSSAIKVINPNLLDGTKVLNQAEFTRWAATGEKYLGKNLGFYAEFTQGMSPMWNKMFAIQPGRMLNHLRREEAWKTLGNYLDAVGFSTKKADLILDEFADIKDWNQVSADEFGRQLAKASIALVGQRKGVLGDKRKKVLEKSYDKLFDTLTKVRNYANDPDGNVIPTRWSARTFDEAAEEYTFLPSLTKLTEAANQGTPLFNVREVNRTLGRWFDEVPDIEGGIRFNKRLRTYIRETIDEHGLRYLKIPTRKIEEDMVTMLLDYWMNEYFKPKSILKFALTQRVLFEEQLAILAHPKLTSMFNPKKYMQWIFAYGQLPRNHVIKKTLNKIWDEGKDVNEVMESYYYHEAINATFQINGLNYRKAYNKTDIKYVVVDPDDPAAMDGYIFQFYKLRNNPISREVAKRGWTDDLFEWSTTPEALKMKEDLIDATGNQFLGRYSIRKQENWLEYLALQEYEIRARTGMRLEIGKHYGTNPDNVGIPPHRLKEYWFDHSDDFSGSLDLRKAIWNPASEYITEGGQKVKLMSWQDPTAPFTFKDLKTLKNHIKELTEATIDKGLTQADEKLYNFGKVVVEEFPTKGRADRIADRWDDALGTAFEWILTTPLRVANRSPVFKQFRYLYLKSNFEDFTPRLQKQYIDEAIEAAVPKSEINALKGISALKSGSIDNYKSTSDAASAYAVANMKDLLYDTRQRHRLSDITRNIFPFPEIFFEIAKRWGKLAMQNPYFFRQANVTYKGVRSVGGNYLYQGHGRVGEDPVSGEEIFVRAFQPWDYIFGDDAAASMVGVNYLSGVNMVAQQAFPSTSPLVSYGMKHLFDTDRFATVQDELNDFFFDTFPPPEDLQDALLGGKSPWLTKARVVGDPWSLFKETTSETWLGEAFDYRGYVDPDNNFVNWDMTNHLNSMRAETSIEVWNMWKEGHEEERILKTGELDKYIRSIYTDWNGSRDILPARDGNGNVYVDGRLTQDIVDRALMKMAVHKARHLFMYRTITQFGTITGAALRSAVKDKSGKWWSTAVLTQEYLDLLNDKYFGDHTKAAQEFYNKFGIDHGYLTTSKRDKTGFSKGYDESNRQWIRENRDKIDNFPTTFHYLNPDNPQADRNYNEMIQDVTKNPEKYLLGANDTVGWFRYQRFSEQVENAPITSKQKRALKEQARAILTDKYPGFQSNYGIVEPTSAAIKFQEMETKWLNDKWALSTSAGAGFAEFYEDFWKPAIEQSKISSGTGSKTWWRNSKDPVALTIRARVAQGAYGVISEHPDFWNVYMNIIIRLWESDSEIMDYNSMLEARRRMEGTR